MLLKTLLQPKWKPKQPTGSLTPCCVQAGTPAVSPQEPGGFGRSTHRCCGDAGREAGIPGATHALAQLLGAHRLADTLDTVQSNFFIIWGKNV